VSQTEGRTDTLIASVSERVREMAESTVEDCRRMLDQAEADGEATRQAAREDADRARAGLRQVGDIVTELAEAVAALHAQLTGMATRIDLARIDLDTRFPTPAAATSPPAPDEEEEAQPSEPLPPRSTDLGAAHLLALNMALNGMERDELDRHLAERFDLPDRAALLDDVYHRRPLRGHG
jgi:hypothetical protein